MFAKRYNADELIDIIAAPAYSPELIEYVKKVANAPYLSQFLSQKPKLGITGTIAKDYVSADTKDAVPYVSTKQVKGLHAYMDDAKYISKEADIEWAKCRVEDGDIIINKSGNVGAAAVLCCAPYKYVNSVSDIINIKLDKTASIDRDFLVVYLNSPYGQKQLQRLSGGAIFSHVSLHAIPDIRVYHPDIKAQKYIADKVRQAEQLRTWAKRCREKIQYYFNDLFSGISLDKPEHLHTRVSLDILVPRLNAEFYSDYYMQVEKGLIDRFGKLTTLGRLAPTIRTKTKPSTDCVYKEIGDLDAGKGAFDSGTFHKFGEAPNNAQRIFDEGDVAVSTRRPNRGAIAVIEESSSTTFYSVFLARLKPKDRNFGYWLKEFLRHDAGKLLLLQRCTWTTYPVISEDDIESIPVPEIPDHWDFIARLSRKSVKLEAVATDLITTTKILVETLIEGQLTEQQLIEAQQALEDGDNSLDQAILSKLSAEGYAIEGATPLFSDVDELYSLLEEAAQAEAEE
ncbi:restriction endonuclease subunit S [Pantoea ananatis]|uniref:restriction endonuclease subunit S n=1 Tax=Pantoea ananas TaxID=553 RepID=UPI001B301CAB|nr:restriction endonuclease subunit S [Pantoea ananatis]